MTAQRLVGVAVALVIAALAVHYVRRPRFGRVFAYCWIGAAVFAVAAVFWWPLIVATGICEMAAVVAVTVRDSRARAAEAREIARWQAGRPGSGDR